MPGGATPVSQPRVTCTDSSTTAGDSMPVWTARTNNGREGFWGYLKRNLSAKGGIRRDRLPLYLAEYVWRYNVLKTFPGRTTERNCSSYSMNRRKG